MKYTTLLPNGLIGGNFSCPEIVGDDVVWVGIFSGFVGCGLFLCFVSGCLCGLVLFCFSITFVVGCCVLQGFCALGWTWLEVKRFKGRGVLWRLVGRMGLWLLFWGGMVLLME